VPVTSVDVAAIGMPKNRPMKPKWSTASAASTATRELLDWQPTGPTLLEDIADGAYTAPRG
jgi:hypothetical protein